MTKPSFGKLAVGLGVFALMLCVPLAASAPVYPKDYYSTNNPLFDISNVDAPPKPVVQAPPVLTPDLLALKKSALVTVEYIISKTGEVEFPLVVDSSDSRFDLITVEAVAQWKFKPAKKKGKPVNCRVRQVLTYN